MTANLREQSFLGLLPALYIITTCFSHNQQVLFFFLANCSDHYLVAWDLGASVDRHSIVPSSKTVRPCSPYWTLEDNMVDGCSSAPHSQAAEGAIPHFCKQERKCSTLLWRRLSRTQALRGRVAPRGWLPMSGMKMRSLVGWPPNPHSIGDPPTAPHVDCCCQMNWWVVVRRVQMDVSTCLAFICTR